MSDSQFGRQSLVLCLCSAAVVVLGNAVFGNPKANFREIAHFDFPQQVPLAGWQMQDSQPLATQRLNNGKALPGWHYRYQLNQELLNIKLRYITDAGTSKKNLQQMLQTFTPISESAIQTLTVKHHPEVGFYSQFVDKQTSYLSACVNPLGGSTVTSEQFSQNRNLYDLRLNRFWDWFLGRAKLKDNRCLWVILSLQRNLTRPNISDQKLETAGVVWLSWWQVHFPKF
jgi:cyanosortase A-associated protein